MADVKIIDIDSEQWNIKDQEARNIIAVLEQKIRENTDIIKKLNKNVQEGFLAHRMVKKIVMYPFETCFISGYVNNVGSYMAILVAKNGADLIIEDLYGQVSKYMSVKVLSQFEYELSLDGPISIFGFVQGAS